MPYWRMDLDGPEGEHLAVFAESDYQGAIKQQFAFSLDTSLWDLKRTKLTTLADLRGVPFRAIDLRSLPWVSIKPTDYELAVEAKRRIFERDIQVENDSRRAGAKTGKRCGRCGGSGHLVTAKLTCPDCKGEGTI